MGCVLLAVALKSDKGLLVKHGKAAADSTWAIPSDSAKQKNPLQAAAERELFAETGLYIRASEPVDTFNLIAHDCQDDIIVIVELTAEYRGKELDTGNDVWVTEGFSADLCDLDMNTTSQTLLEGSLQKAVPFAK